MIFYTSMEVSPTTFSCSDVFILMISQLICSFLDKFSSKWINIQKLEIFRHIGFYGCCLYSLVALFFLEIPALLVDVRKLVSISTTTNKDVEDHSTKDVNDPNAESDSPGETSICTPSRPSQVQIGNDGTVTVSSHCWETAKACSTPNGMAMVPLMGLFSVDVLLKSNLKGGVSKLDPTADRRQALESRPKETSSFTRCCCKPFSDGQGS
ncbi:uncharacterized protein [Misgurnus anguillicaudatus]|uniref:uncharacterized protein n=1 Tax=Misgurnus anguillicaudatus TaxID=75329 RepID=UPI003CCF3451